MATIKTIAANENGKNSLADITATFGALNTAKQEKVFVTVGPVEADYITDGVADDVQIQAALDFLNAAGGGCLFLEFGAYQISDNLATYSNIEIVGAGVGSVLRLAQGKSLRLWNINDVVFRNLRVDATQHIAFDVAVSIINVSNVKVHDNTVDATGYGIFINANSSNTTDGVWVTDNIANGYGNNDVIGGGAAVNTATVKNVFIERNKVTQDASQGTGYTGAIDLVKANRWTYTDNKTQGDVLFGGETSPHEFSQIIGNDVSPAIGVSSCLISVAVNPGDTQSTKGIIISLNTVNAGYINLSGVNTAILIESIIHGNTIIGAGQPSDGIKLSYVQWVHVSHNSVQGAVNGINIGAGSTFNQITFNTIDNCTNGIVENASAGNNSHVGNIMGSVTTPYSLQASSTLVSFFGGNVGIGIASPGSPLSVLSKLVVQTASGSGASPTIQDMNTYAQIQSFNSRPLVLNNQGNGVGVGTTTVSAILHLKSGTATAGTAPLKMNSGTNLTAAEDGAFEYDGAHLYFTIGSTRHTLI